MGRRKKRKSTYGGVENAPRGWVHIETWLPECRAEDLINKGYSTIKVKYEDGHVRDANITPSPRSWYEFAKQTGITHWWNGKQSFLTYLFEMCVRNAEGYVEYSLQI